MEEDDKLKELFARFNPQLRESDNDFLGHLQRSMDAVELIRKRQKALKRRSRIAVAVAAVCGFAMGSLLTLFLPMMGELLGSLHLTLPDFGVSAAIDLLPWIVVAAASVFTAISAYDLTMARLTLRDGISDTDL